MRRFRFHLGTLVILILLLAVGFAALRESNEIWGSSILSITLGLLLISILLAIHRTDKRRVFWLGFALFGSAYLALTLIPSIESRLITTKALAYVDSKVPDRSIVHIRRVWDTWSNDAAQNSQSTPSTSIDLFSQVDSATAGNSSTSWTWMLTGGFTRGGLGSTMNFIRIGHSILTLIAAMLGGLLSRYVYKTNRQVNIGSDTNTGFDLE